MTTSPFEGITPEAAGAIMDHQIRERLSARDFSIDAAAADVFEVPLPEGVDVQVLDQRIWYMGAKLIVKSYEE